MTSSLRRKHRTTVSATTIPIRMVSKGILAFMALVATSTLGQAQAPGGNAAVHFQKPIFPVGGATVGEPGTLPPAPLMQPVQPPGDDLHADPPSAKYAARHAGADRAGDAAARPGNATSAARPKRPERPAFARIRPGALARPRFGQEFVGRVAGIPDPP